MSPGFVGTAGGARNHAAALGMLSQAGAAFQFQARALYHALFRAHVPLLGPLAEIVAAAV